MNTDRSERAVEMLIDWYRENSNLLNEACTNHKLTETKFGSAYVDFDTATHMNRVTVWDHKFCLDIQHLDISTDASKFPFAGTNETPQQFREKLVYIEEWLKDKIQVLNR